MNNIKRILLDLDGVLYDFVGGACRLHGWDPIDLDWETYPWNFHRQHGITDGDFWGEIDRAGATFWSGLDQYPWAARLYSLAAEYAHSEVYICTSPPLAPSAAAGKVKAIQRFMGPVNHRKFIITPQKHLLAQPGVILIDDSHKNINAFRDAGGEAILFPQPWNDNRLRVGDRITFTKTQLTNYAEK